MLPAPDCVAIFHRHMVICNENGPIDPNGFFCHRQRCEATRFEIASGMTRRFPMSLPL